MSTQSVGSTDALGDAKELIVTYEITPPGGVWASSDNGTYTVILGGAPIADLAGNTVVAGRIASFTVGIPYNSTQVNLSSAFNRTGIVADGTKFSGGGLDGHGYAYSSTLLGTSLTAGGATFVFGPAGSADVVSAAGQTISLPSGNDSDLELLATGVNGSQPNQTFTVTYTDGTTAKFTQSLSDWAAPQGYPGESTALKTSYRDTSSGSMQAGNFNIYEYAFALNPTKVVKSVTLPTDANLEVLAIDLLT
jgi:hypothetical protein